MLYRTISFWVCLVGISVLAIILTNLPLFNLLAFEFCAIITIYITFVGAYVAMTEVQSTKKRPDLLADSPPNLVLRIIFRALYSNFIILFIPLIIILLNSFRVNNCNIAIGCLFYLLLPMLSCVVVTTAGVFFCLWIEKRWVAYLLYLFFLILSLIPTFSNLIFHPPVFAYHPILGYFPGPIYDNVIPITSVLFVSRTETLILAALFTIISCITCEVGRKTAFIPKIQWRNLISLKTKRPIWAIGMVYLLIISLLSVELLSGKLGIRPSRHDIEQTLGGYKETEHFEIYYDQELEEQIELFADDCEFQYSLLSDYMEGDISRKVRAYLYSSPQQKKTLIGAGNTYVEDPFGYGFHLHVQGFPHPVLKHELAHVFTADWSPIKVSLNVGIHEGIAVAADWNEGKLTVHQWAKAMQELNLAPSLSSVMGLGFWRHAGSRSYLLAGSFVRFLVDRYGIDAFKRAFPIGDLTKAYNRNIVELEQEWLNYLSNEVVLDNEDLMVAKLRLTRGGIFEQVCAHEIASLKDKAWKSYYKKNFVTATSIFQTALSHEPNNPSILRGLMYSSFQANKFNLSVEYANQIISDEKALYKAEAALLIGDIHWLEDNEDDALKSYLLAKSLNPRESVEIKLIKRLEVLSDAYFKESQEILRRILISNNPLQRTENATSMALLQQAIDNEPNSWLTYYLVGELLHFEKAWGLSSQYLDRISSVSRDLDNIDIGPQLLLRIHWLLGINSFHLKKYKLAEEIFSAIVDDSTLHIGTRLSAEYWIARCQWTKKRKTKR